MRKGNPSNPSKLGFKDSNSKLGFKGSNRAGCSLGTKDSKGHLCMVTPGSKASSRQDNCLASKDSKGRLRLVTLGSMASGLPASSKVDSKVNSRQTCMDSNKIRDCKASSREECKDCHNNLASKDSKEPLRRATLDSMESGHQASSKVDRPNKTTRTPWAINPRVLLVTREFPLVVSMRMPKRLDQVWVKN